MASLRNSNSYDRQNDQRGEISGCPSTFIEVEIISVKQGVQEIRERRAIQVFVGCSPWLPHLGKQPEIGEHRVLQSVTLFVTRFGAQYDAFCWWSSILNRVVDCIDELALVS